MGKPKKKQPEGTTEEDVTSELASLTVSNDNGIDASKMKPEKKSKKIIPDESSDSDMDDGEVQTKKDNKKKNKAVASFNLLNMLEDDSNSDRKDSDDERSNIVLETVAQNKQSKKAKDKKKKKGKADQELDDIDAILADIESVSDKKGQKGKKDKKKAAPTPATTTEAGDAKKTEETKDEVNEELKAKAAAAAQKKKEKKEREKLKKQQEKQKESEAQAKEKTPEISSKTGETGTQDGTKGDSASRAGSEEPETSSKKKKKAKKEEPVKKPKGQIAKIKEALEKMKEEEERIRKEEEERERMLAEIERKKEEQRLIEEERKRRKKQKEKEKKEQLKAEGKLLTEKQKHERMRAQQMLDAMRSQGLELPVKDESAPKKRIVYADKKKKRVQTDDSKKDESATGDESKTGKGAATEVKPVEVKQLVKDSWDISSEEESESDTKTKGDEDESSDDDDDNDSLSDESECEESTPIERARERILKRREAAEKKRRIDVLRAPVVCVLGHVDTGKTKILDKLRRTNVQDGEAGGITQQIGATNVPHEALKEATKMVKEKPPLKLPGLLIIDTPGHESFSNLRSRGSSLCDIAILVVDIMHGLEPQTIESINLLKSRKTPFVIALNKVDRLFQWKTSPQTDVSQTIKKQNPNTKIEFDERSKESILQISEQGLNAALFYENKNVREYINVVPTSAHSGDGMGNLLATICELTQTLLAKRISYSEELQATVMEVKALLGMGTTIDVILVNGKLKEGDTIVVAGTEGPIVTQIRGLLTPEPMKELRVKAQYQHHKELMAAQGVKIMAKDLEKALAGLPLYVAKDQDEIDYYKAEVANALKEVLSGIKLQERGVFVQASTLGSMEALLEFLRTSKIPYAGINIGPIHKKDIMKASVMLEHDEQYAVILAFDVKIERDAQELADTLGVRIFSADIIYHLFDKFMSYREELKKKRQGDFRHIAVFPCKLRVMPEYIFNSRDPIVVGVCVEAGFVKEGTPLCVPSKEFVEIGRVSGIENNHKQVEVAKKGQEVCIKIEPIPGEAPKMFGRHFDHTDVIMSKISRQSIDVVKDYFRDEMTKTDWQLIVELKKLFQII
ncbi:eukaryotic translation initiation factor 5B-like isoform X1 [Argonauta hians]